MSCILILLFNLGLMDDGDKAVVAYLIIVYS